MMGGWCLGVEESRPRAREMEVRRSRIDREIEGGGGGAGIVSLLGQCGMEGLGGGGGEERWGGGGGWGGRVLVGTSVDCGIAIVRSGMAKKQLW